MKTKINRLFSFSLALLLVLMMFPQMTFAETEITLPDLISNNMMIQQAKPIKVWGNAKPGETVKVTLQSGEKIISQGTATVADDGSFKAELPAVMAGGPYTLNFSAGTATKTVSNVLVGELWVQSGQSNMVKTVSYTGSYAEDIIPDETIDGIRFFYNTTDQSADVAQTDISGEWKIATPTNVNGYSAVGYTALKKLYDELNMPVGGICTAIGGVSMAPYTGPVGETAAGGRYNTKIAPLTNFNVRGAMWYQGEADRTNKAENVDIFVSKFSNLISSWRTAWNDADMPFVYVTLPPSPLDLDGDKQITDFTYARLAQLKSYYEIDNVAFAVSMDCPPEPGEDKLHPRNKKPVGERLGLAALDLIYDTIDNGRSPLYKKVTVNGNSATIEFNHTYGGLKTTDGKAPRCFMAAGDDGVFRAATRVVITGKNQVTATFNDITTIKKISYAVERHMYTYATANDESFAGTYADVNLVNSEGLPACPFFYDLSEVKAEKAERYTVEEVHLTAKVGEKLSLPATVQLYENGNLVTRNVMWSIESVDTSVLGTTDFYGFAENADVLIPAKASVTDDSGVVYYTVNFETDGAAPVESQSIAAGEKVTAPAVPEREGYTFAGWFTDSACKVAYDFESPVNNSFTIYAGWESNNAYILYRDFTQGVSDDDLAAMNDRNFGTTDGLVARRPEVSRGTDSLRLTMSVLASTYNPSSFIFCEGGLTGSQTENRNAFMPKGDLALKGKVVLEAEMKFDTVEGVTHYPLSIVGSNELTKTGGILYNYASRMIKIDNGKCYVANQEKCTINPNQYYKFKIAMDIDGDETTTNDPFTATVSDGVNNYTGSGTVYYKTTAGMNDTLKSIGYVHILKTVAASADTTVTTDIKNLKFYYAETPIITASIEDGAEGIAEGSNITLKFDQSMDTDTFNKIALKDSIGNEVKGITITAANDKTCVVTLPSAMKSISAYQLVIPETVLSHHGIAVAEKTINFVSAKSNVILYRDFTQGIIEADITAMNTSSQGTSDGLVMRSSASSSSGTNSLKVSLNASNTTYNPPSFIFCEGGITGSQTENRNAFMPKGDLELKGNIVLEAEMKFDTVEGVTHYPLSIVGSNELTKTGGIAFNYASRMIKIDNGKCYVANQERCTIKPDQYYKFKIVMDIDGDETTTDDSFTASVTDGENTYSGSGDVYYKTTAGWNTTLKSIGYIHVIKTVSGSSEAVMTNTDIKSLKFYYPETPVMTASIEDGTWDVEAGSKVTLAFDQTMDTATFNNITLKDSFGNEVSGLTITAEDSRNCIVTLPSVLSSLSEYQLVIPETVLSHLGIAVTKKTIKFVSAKNNIILYRDFTQGISDADITAMNNRNQGTADGLVSRRGDASSGTDTLKLSMIARAADAYYNPSSLIFCKGGITSSQTENRNNWMPNGDLALKGKIVLEAEMKFDTVEGVAYYPLSIVGSNELTKTAGYLYTYASNMIKIDDGICYIDRQEKGVVKPNQYYKFQITMNIDGDETTTDDPFTATVTDGESTYTGSGTVYYKSTAGWNTALKSIGYIHVVKPISKSSAEVATNTEIKTLKFYYDEEAVSSDYITAEVTCSSFEAGKDVNVTALFTNETNISLTPCLVAALYDGNGKLADITIVATQTLSGGGSYNMETSLSLPEDADENSAYVKVFAWGGSTSINPVMKDIVK